MRIGAFLLFFFCLIKLSAQEVKVLDSDSRKPLADVAIFNQDRSTSAITDTLGIADLSSFSSEELLTFSIISHEDLYLRKKEILNNTVLLEADNNQLDQVVLSVSRFKLDRDEVPQKIVSITPSEVQLASPQTSADLLESTGQVYVQKSQLGGGSPMIRGFSTNRLLITVDGVRMNTAIFRSGNLQNVISIDPMFLDKAEVILGPGSVVYGSDAVGGVMNFYTLQPNFSFDGNTSFSGNIYTRFATANNENTVHADLNIGRENWAFTSAVTYSDFGDLKMGSHGPDDYLRPDYAIRENGEDLMVENDDPEVQKPTGYNQLNLLQKVKYMPADDWDLSLGLIYSETSDFPRYDRLYRKRDGILRAAEWYYGPQKWFLGDVNINHRSTSDFFDKVQFTGAYQFFAESRNDRDFGKPTLYSTEENVDAYSANLDFEKEWANSKFFYGLEYVLNNVASNGSFRNIETNETGETASRYPDGSQWQSIAVYLGHQWRIREDLSLQSGLRYNHILVDTRFDDRFYDFPFETADISTGALTGSLGINWKQSDFLRLRAGASTAFRAPNIDDIGKIFDSEPGSVVVPNPDLKPEYAYNGEIGADLNFNDFIRLNLTGYYTYLDNAMVRRDYSLNGETEIDYQGEPSRVQAIQNAAHAYVYGIETGLEANLSVALRLTSQFSYTYGREDEGGEYVPLRHAAPLFGNTHLIWNKRKLKFDLFAEYNGQFNFEDLAPGEQDKPYLYALDSNGNPYSPSWYTLNLTGQYKMTSNWLATVSLENITDQRYRTYSSGISAAGRNLIIGLNYTF
ncbi:TonB-dependent receptor plug domain-containing protein [Christiangramia flava]|uniref:TonB-dependent receptor n=1 Tax=Christiangramia flava JLT2011 TaxID=1229726 RepID=A0A1L7I342_9FLAO|nr:TonB-dependent receptor [Christiangramia flava]APU67991.1 TonB-dependent receptor [Christiangramia flava JLT2011]OSS40492.1 TonB-dependent receptor [Christiangramia flava JLT2011]